MHSQYGKLIVQAGPTTGETYPLPREETVIGRDPSVDIVISSTAVSRRHARLLFDGQRYYIEDLASSNGTFVNGERITSKRLLQDGDQISLGQSIRLLFSVPLAETRVSHDVELDMDATRLEADVLSTPSPAAPATARPAQQQQPPLTTPAPRLTVTVGGFSTQSYTLTEPELTFGRADSNDIVVRSPIISRLHARLVRQANGEYALVPLPEASNPVIHNNEPLSNPYLLQDQDELFIGRPGSESVVQLRYESAASQQVAARQPAVQQPAATQHIDWRPATPASAATSAAMPAAAADSARTMLQQDFQMEPMSIPPRFEVVVAGNPPHQYTLTDARITIGRAEDNDIVVPSRIFSRYHAYLQRDPSGGYQFVPLPEASNPVQHQGRPLSGPHKLRHQDLLRVGGADPGSMVTMTYVSPAEATSVEERTLDFTGRDLITIGRDPNNDLVLDNPTVSRYHAQIEKVGQRFRVRDLRSSNGTFVNGQRIDEGEVWLKQGDSVRVGNVVFEMGDEKLAQVDEGRGLRVEALGLNKWVRKDLNILQDISLVFQPREFIVVVGQSGGGKTTLVDAIAGYRPATHGRVLVNEVDVYRNFDAIRNEIGYVPQKDIIHMELTVFQALDYAAQLRMPPDTTKEERHRRIQEVLDDLDIAHRKDTQISQLSGGQQKRVSIGVELLTKPGLFFLDEPTSGLDPGTETALMQLMRRLADQGRTIVLITHATKNVMLADKVVFLARGGYLAWFGPPDEALAYFDQYRNERDRRTREMEFDEIYAVLDDPSKGSAQEWAERFRNHPAYQQYIAQPLANENLVSQPANVDGAPKPKRKRQVSSLRQLKILSARNLRILSRDRFALLLMLAAAPMVSLLDVVLSLALGRNVFDTRVGSIQNVMITLFLLSVYGVMVGGLSQMREIVKEQDIYKRERLVNLRLLPYILSKIWVAALLALYQSLVYVFVHYIVFDMPGSWLEFGLIYITLALATFSGMMLGLFASALSPNANSAPLIVTLLVLPQIVLAGALVPLPGFVTGITSTRWAFQNFMAITGAGSDVAADACWLLTEEEQKALAANPEAMAGCRCLGTNILTQCNFPGVARTFNEAALRPPPQEPDIEIPPTPGPPPVPPPTPVFPPTPAPPTDEGDVIAAQEYREAFEAYQAEVLPTQEAFEGQLAQFQAELDLFQADVDSYPQKLSAVQEIQTAYAQELQAWAEQSAAAVVPAESAIRVINEGFGWTFTNKEDPQVYWGVLGTSWAMLIAINAVLFVGILILQKRKDVA